MKPIAMDVPGPAPARRRHRPGANGMVASTMVAKEPAGFTLRHIPYKGSAPALMSIVSGETDVMVSPTVVAIAQIQAD